MTLSLPCIPSPQIPHSSTNNSINNTGEISSKPVPESITKRLAKPHVKTACVNCKKAHLACDLTRPCKRCISSDKADTCHDIQHKKRGRPKLRGIKPMHCHLPSTFTMIQSTTSSSNYVKQHSNTSNYQKPTMTIFLSMELCCARVSDESFDFLGLYPQEFSHRSLYEFISPGNSGTISRIHRSLLDNAVTFYSGDEPDNSDSHHLQQEQQQRRKRAKLLPPTQRTTADMFVALPPYQLSTVANGSLTLKDTISFVTSDKSRLQPLDTRFYLGGGSGADLMQPNSLQHLYIVCILTLPDSNTSLNSLPEQQSSPNIPSFANNSGPDQPIYTTSNTLTLAAVPSLTELQPMEFGQDQLQSSTLKSEQTPLLDFEQDNQQHEQHLKRPTKDTSGTDVIQSTATWNESDTAASPPLSPSSSFSLALSVSSPPCQSDLRSSTADGTPSTATPTKTSGIVTPSPSSSKLFKPPLKQLASASHSIRHARQRQIYQQPHQLYYQSMLSSRLSVEAQAFASSTRMLTAPTMSTPAYNVAKSRCQLRHPPHSTSNTQFHTLTSSASSSSASSSTSTSSSSSLSRSPSSSSACHSSSAIHTTPIATATMDSNTTSTPLYTLPSTSTKLSIYYD